MDQKPNILVLCGRNKQRSRTAEQIFRHDARIQIRSAGVSPSSDRKVTENDLRWADLVCVMESTQRDKIKELYSDLELQKIAVLHIPDAYAFMDEELIELLTDSINELLSKEFNL